MKKRIIVMGDTHCGSMAGLTPPPYQLAFGSTPRRDRFAEIQRDAWDTYTNLLEENQPYDVGIFTADAIEGKAPRSGGAELITPDRDVQCKMAEYCCDEVRKYTNKEFKWYGVYGTPYHVGVTEDFENFVYREAGFEAWSAEEHVEVNKVMINVKHRIGGSSIPHGRFTGLAKEALWNMYWNRDHETPKGDIFVRGHVHYFAMCCDPGFAALTVPALQVAATKYGARHCVGTVHWGFVIIDIEEDGEFQIYRKIRSLKSLKPEIRRP